MKKIFTLMAAALMAASVSAKEAIDISSICAEGTTNVVFSGSWEWKGITLSTGELVLNDEAKTADDSGITYFDASKFDYLCLKYSASTCDVNVIAQQQCLGTIGQWGAEFNQKQATASVSAQGGFVGVALDKENANKIMSVALQCGQASGSITVEEMFWATAEEYEAIKAAQPVLPKEINYKGFGGYNAENDQFVFAAGSAGWYNLWLGTLDPTEFKSIVIEVASSNGEVQLVAQGDHAEGAVDHIMIAASDQPQKYYFDVTGWTNFSQFAFQNFNFPDPTIEDWNTKQATALETTMKITAMYLTVEEAPVPAAELWTVAGGANLMGADWNPAEEANDMTTTDGVVYKLVKEGVVLEKGVNYQFKVAKDHAWSEAYPAQNYEFTVEETGTYTVTITFNAESKEIAVETVKTGEAVIGEKVYSVIGTIVGNWDVDTNMELDGNVYKAVFTDVAAGSYEFKIRVNGDWSENYPSSNFKLDVPEDGMHVVVTFNPETKEVDAAAVPAGISSVVMDAQKGAVYNLAGQKAAAHKGFVIANGKKFISK